MEAFEESTKTGERIYQKHLEQGPHTMPISSNEVQVALAKFSVKETPSIKPMDRWMEGEADEDSLSRRWRAYVVMNPDKMVDITDEAFLEQILEEIKATEPERTVH